MVPWRRWREPLAVTLLVALALMLAVRAVRFIWSVGAGDSSGSPGVPADDLLLLAAAAAVLWCTTPVAEEAGADPTSSRHAWPIAVVGFVVVGATVLGWLAVSVWSLVRMVETPASPLGFVLSVVEGVLRLVVPAAALVAVGLALRRAAAVRRAGSVPSGLTGPTEEGVGEDVPSTPVPERLPAAWQADEATGAVWLTADDAAQGRPGLSWSNPTGPGGATPVGWTPAPHAAQPDPPPSAAWDSAPRGAREVPVADAPVARPQPDAPSRPRSAAEDDDLR